MELFTALRYLGGKEITMQLNTTESFTLGRRVHNTFGSWRRARELAVRTENGVYKLDDSAVEKASEVANKAE